MGAGLLVIALALVAGAVLRHASAAPPTVAASNPRSAPVWTVEANPPHRFALPSPELGWEPTAYEARSQQGGPDRDDTLTFNQFGDAERVFVRLTIAQSRDPAPPAFFVDMARAAAPAGLAITRNGPASLLASRFGPIEAAEIGVASWATCLGFRSPPTLGVRLVGLACGPGGHAPDATKVVCALDRLDITSAASDDALAAYFAKAALADTPGCAPTPLVRREPDPAPRAKRHRSG